MKDIVFFDLETTGVSTTADRICQIAAVKVNHELDIIDDIKDYLINPGIPIPAGATEVHGITDEMVKDAPTFKAISRGISSFMQGCDLGGFNSNRFDIPLLSEEFARFGISFPEPEASLIDGYQIYATEEKRDLKSATFFYCNKILIDAHNAKADILATLDVFRAQRKKYEHLHPMTIKEIDLHYGGNVRVDLAGTIVLDEGGIAVYNIGKDKGKPVVTNPGFAQWMLKQDFSGNTKAIIRQLLNIR